MSIDAAVRAKLAEVLEPVVAGRVYIDAAPAESPGFPGQSPYCVFQHAGDDSPANLTGGGAALRRDTYAVAVWGRDGGPLEEARELLRRAFRGANCQGAWGRVWVCGARTRDAAADIEPPGQGDEEVDRVTTASLEVVWESDYLAPPDPNSPPVYGGPLLLEGGGELLTESD